ncbi:MAG: hypothetical protein Q7K45_01695 [Nanoarchaeota archaeon]|nr:hypothetical protein [Nanoarchaeota archaeon]
MALQLSGRIEELPRLYRELNGRVVDTMPLLVSGRDEKGNIVDIPRTPASFGYVLERRETAPEDVRKEWQMNYIFTGDLVATGVDGDIVSVWDSPLLRSLTSESKLNNGALILSTAQWNELKSQKDSLYLTAEQAAQAHQKAFVKQEGVWTPQNKEVAKIWDHLGRGRDLASYAAIVGDATSSESIMNVYVDASARKLPTGRAWVARSIVYLSGAFGSNYLSYDDGRLVGVAPEAHVVREKVLEARVLASHAACRAYELGENLWVPVPKTAGVKL